MIKENRNLSPIEISRLVNIESNEINIPISKIRRYIKFDRAKNFHDNMDHVQTYIRERVHGPETGDEPFFFGLQSLSNSRIGNGTPQNPFLIGITSKQALEKATLSGKKAMHFDSTYI